ncbi:MAG: hypothetical protein RM368_36150 [Nostoc sp. DedSLP03]|uniref:hypothetical protein n=1 Tax=Nostoc sp. DedSLP03 TaxID=3075400 RepID=UPI002AD51063|nr:hypothetical protein [Nostoc sp. DedSLP03]MDZ7970304.1 hypothetical protein [Nostoc sp. DedSLP03]
MSYREGLRPWAVFQRLPEGQSNCVARFRTQSDADAFASIFRRGGGVFEVVFDLPQAQELTKNR